MFFITSFITWHGFSDMVDVCEIPFRLTVIEYVDGAPFQDGGSEQPLGHVGSATRAIDREVAQTGGRKTVKVAIPYEPFLLVSLQMPEDESAKRGAYEIVQRKCWRCSLIIPIPDDDCVL